MGHMGGEVTPLSWRKCQKVAPSWSGFLGPPLGVVLPSATRPGNASWTSVTRKVGRKAIARHDNDPERCSVR